MDTNVLERAVAEPAKITAAAGSLASWYRYEMTRLRALRKLLWKEIDQTSDMQHRTELLDELERSQAEQRQLDEGWKNSSLRQRLDSGEKAEQPTDISGVEQRLLVTSKAKSTIAAQTPKTGSIVKLNGLASVYDKLSENLGGFVEKIQDGAFDGVLRDSTTDVRALYNHDSNLVLGRSCSGTLRLSSIPGVGLNFWCDLIPEDSLSAAITERISRKDLTGCSFSFIADRDRDKWELRPGKTDVRIITRIERLFDVGPVTYPAYPDTTVAVVRCKPDEVKSDFWADDVDLEFEEFLQERKEEIGRKYQHAGRIIKRCRQRL